MRKVNIKKQIILCKKRTKKHLKRKKRKKKIPYRFMGEKISKIITIPTYMDLNNNLKETLKFITKLGKNIREKDTIVINHKYMEKISQEALLLLTSEIERSIKYLKENKKHPGLKGNKKFMPKNENIKELLNKIGYWKYFNIKSKKNKTYHKERYYLKIKSDIKANAMYVGELITLFEKIVFFEDNFKDKFNDALFEAVANVVEHAYIEKQDVFVIEGKWWLTAYLDSSKNIVSFTIFDQGIGIFKSLNSPKRKKPIPNNIKNLLDIIKNRDFSKILKQKEYPKISLLRKLIHETEKLSRYDKVGRGNGFKSFKKFIDEVEDGEMLILTDNIWYNVISDESKILDNPINGTLISWKIKLNKDTNKKIHLKEIYYDNTL
jgi:hypothetical protein